MRRGGRRGRKGDGANNPRHALGRIDLDAPILAAVAPGAGIALPDEHAGGVLAIDEEAHEQPSIAIALSRPIGTKVDWARAGQRFEPPLGQFPEATLRVALRPVNLRGVDAEQPLTLGANMERIAVDDGQGGDSGERRNKRVCPHAGQL
jgi:hypothetical protein